MHVQGRSEGQGFRRKRRHIDLAARRPTVGGTSGPVWIAQCAVPQLCDVLWLHVVPNYLNTVELVTSHSAAEIRLNNVAYEAYWEPISLGVGIS